MKTEATIKNLGEIFYVHAPIGKALDQLRKTGAETITLRDLAYARIREGAESHISQHGSYVKQACIHMPRNKIIFTNNSPILEIDSVLWAIKDYRLKFEFNVDAKSYLEQAEEDKSKSPEQRRTIMFDSARYFSIPTNRFADEELTRWAFKDQAKQYGEFLRENGVNKISGIFVNVDSSKEPFARQLWLCRINDGGRSVISSNDHDLGNDCMIRGLRSVSSKAVQDFFSNMLLNCRN